MPDHDQPRPEQDAPEPIVTSVTANSTPDRGCRACGQNTLQIVTVTALIRSEERVVGGWALCASCGASPHPVMEVPDA
ncbi:hypothetical protein [Streptomyces sp. A1136]|uniref:hypothetical protein n=1 Tax=Streptomyces sp. A1136 TaxID=2563102 RepID=UPI00109E6A51|nr:hypothetical protein [Streptomyces sp. A1136]THA54238.1 hypothetical protein E6R62_16870 [Streptomyces sp. A1136]